MTVPSRPVPQTSGPGIPAGPRLGLCGADLCDRQATAYLIGPTHGRSPRITLITGVRAAELSQPGNPDDDWLNSDNPLALPATTGDPLALRCTECALNTVEQMLTAHDPTAATTPDPLLAPTRTRRT